MMSIICESCAKRHYCNFFEERKINLENLTAQVSKEAGQKIKDIVTEDITCNEYVKEDE